MILDNLYNYYERLIADYINRHGLVDTKEPEYLADLCCLALNQLPARYIRHEVDMAFYLHQSERLTMEMNVNEAMEKSMAFLEKDESVR
ncbi:late competence development ComFB family protein [Echinimonas agarilytica]|uniref:Late competence development ComFB family protein n=1 Tax=Echinimonas agarilytica TaxID=1215918 RepID=A0AA41W6W1_9GAMM|nr:late competence development ComFB family protein [Echinimonas agarilytica]MCM2679817.1 late competence development ComFB family protein [Echinimonas agarilytica]